MQYRVLSIAILAASLCSGEDASHPLDSIPPKPTDERVKESPLESLMHKHTNALSRETSPYLLQHAHNPVNWYPWGEEAFEKAKREDKPIFLSVGYSSCHWCHVMEHESFENEDVAKVMNANFISIKVDREERPDVDEIYMAAVQILSQRGGWPMSVFMTPDGRPFYGGTYFPRVGFVSLLEQVAEVWKKKRQDIVKDADTLSGSVREYLSRHTVQAKGPLSQILLTDFVEEMHHNFDAKLGGFGTRPKFPPNNGLPLLLYIQTHPLERGSDPRIASMTTVTLDNMAMGGIHDQLAGGFHRYSTDDRWLVPHFEKMLYDNALLSAAYADASVVYSNPEYARVARGVYDWVLREMTSPDGGFYSTLDADSEGEEGKFYVWSKTEIEQILGSDAELFCEIFNADSHGNFHEEASGHATGLNILHLTQPLSAHAKRLKMDEDGLRKKTDAWKAKLLAVRIKRVWPSLDDKILTSWNGLMISSLARGAVALNEPRYKEAAIKAAEFMLKNLRTADGRWLATHRKGQSKLPAYLDDHAFMAVAFLDLFEATRDERWKKEAVEMVASMDKHFTDPGHGGYFFTADDHEKLLARTKDPIDKAIPSGNGWAAQALVRLGRLTGEKSYTDKAAKLFEEFQGLMERAPQATESMLLGLAWHLEKKDTKEDQPAFVEPAAAAGAATAKKGAVGLELLAGQSVFRRGTEVPVAVRFTVSGKYHIQAPVALSGDDKGEGARFTLVGKELGTLGSFKYPEPKILKEPELGEDLRIYEGSVVAGGLLKVADSAALGKQTLSVKVHFQACDDKHCEMPADLVLSLPVEVVEPTAAAEAINAKVFEGLKLGK